jgi:hypothetical protein
MPTLGARVQWVPEWSAAALPEGDAVIATSWQSVEPVAAAPTRCGRKFYFIQHYESLYHGEAARVDATYRIPLRKIVISTWLADIMAERFDTPAAVVVTPVDGALFRPVPVEDDGRLRVLMLFHEYPWKGVADGLEAFGRVRARHPEASLVGFGVKPPPRKLPFAEFHENLPQERLAWLYSRCPIYLCPSWDEGLGMPAMEAMACGAALCTYDNGGCRDYAIDGRTAVAHASGGGPGAEKSDRAAGPGLRGDSVRLGTRYRAAGVAPGRAVAGVAGRLGGDVLDRRQRGPSGTDRAIGPAGHHVAQRLLLDQAFRLQLLEDLRPAGAPLSHGQDLVEALLRGSTLRVIQGMRDLRVRRHRARLAPVTRSRQQSQCGG